MPDDERRYMSVREASEKTGMSRRTIYRRAIDGEIPGAVRIVGRILIPRNWPELLKEESDAHQPE